MKVYLSGDCRPIPAQGINCLLSLEVYLSGDCRPIPALNFAREKLRTNFTAEKAQIRGHLVPNVLQQLLDFSLLIGG